MDFLQTNSSYLFLETCLAKFIIVKKWVLSMNSIILMGGISSHDPKFLEC